MAATCLDRCMHDETSVHLCIACPDEHIAYPIKSHESPKLHMAPEGSLNEEKPEEGRFKSRSLCNSLGRHLGRWKLTIQKRIERRSVALGERVERPKNSFKKRVRISKSSFKKRISASKDRMSQAGKRIQERFVKVVTKLQHVCSRKRDDNRFCPCARYVKVSREHNLVATNDSTADLHKQLRSTGHLSKNWQEPDSRPTSVDVCKINHLLSTRRSSNHTIYQCVSYLNGNENIEALRSNTACRYGEGIDEIHPLPWKRKTLRAFFRRWRYGVLRS